MIWNLDQYLNYLVVNGLIQQQGDQYVIRQERLAFLGYLQSVGYDAEMRTH